MLIDCDSCEVRGLACDDCVVTALLGALPGGVELDAEERRALDVLADTGLVPPLRLVPPSGAGHRRPTQSPSRPHRRGGAGGPDDPARTVAG